MTMKLSGKKIDKVFEAIMLALNFSKFFDRTELLGKP